MPPIEHRRLQHDLACLNAYARLLNERKERAATERWDDDNPTENQPTEQDAIAALLSEIDAMGSVHGEDAAVVFSRALNRFVDNEGAEKMVNGMVDAGLILRVGPPEPTITQRANACGGCNNRPAGLNPRHGRLEFGWSSLHYRYVRAPYYVAEDISRCGGAK